MGPGWHERLLYTMSTVIRSLYRILPAGVIRRLGGLEWLEPFRRLVLRRPDGRYRVVELQVARDYGDNLARFTIRVPINASEKIRSSGVETKLLRRSFTLLRRRLQERPPIILDVGANFGFLSLVWAATLCRHQGCVHAFEPNPYVFQTLCESRKINGFEQNLRVSQVAVGGSSGRVAIGLSDTTSNIEIADDAREVVELDLISLDDYAIREGLLGCDLLKVDVDGSELAVLRGAQELIRRFKPILVVETNGDFATVEFCLDQGYTVFDMDLEPLDRHAPLPANLFCV